MEPAKATSSTGAIEISEIAVNILRPPKRSVRAPTGIRPTEPTRIGVATSSAVWVLDSDIAVEYLVESGPIRFQAQKLIANVHVASARFLPCPVS